MLPKGKRRLSIIVKSKDNTEKGWHKKSELLAEVTGGKLPT